jgi:MFS family permease
MSHNLDLKEIERRVHQSVFQDGLMEIMMGGFLLVVGALFAISMKWILLPSLLVIFLGNPLLERAKKRYIYPRIGYVKLRPEKEADPKGIAMAAIVFVVILLGSGLLTLAIGKDRGWAFWFKYFLPGSTGFMLAIGPFWLGETYGVRRGYVFAVLFLLSGIVIPVLGIASGYEAIGFECLLVGVISLISGVIMFTRFLRNNPVVPEEASYGNH